nr:DUF47 family protein [bacterium]
MKHKSQKTTDYFGYLETSASYACQAAALLDASLSAFRQEEVEEKTHQMHQIEHAADANRHEMLEKLAREFIPPIEREDLIALAQELDNVVDAIDDVMQHVFMFNAAAIPSEALDFTRGIIACCDALGRAVREFRNFRSSKTIKDMIIEVNTLESHGDGLHAQAIRRLFAQENDVRTIMIWQHVFDGFELCFDACEDVADIIASVIMKNT